MLYFLLNREQTCDFFTNISIMQIQLYEDFAKSQAKRGLEQTVGMEVEEEAENEEKKTKVQGTHHVFQVLYMTLIWGVKNPAEGYSCYFKFVHSSTQTKPYIYLILILALSRGVRK